MLPGFLKRGKTRLLLAAGVMTAIIALIDWRVDLNVSFGFLYLFPMLIAGRCLPRWQLAAVAGLCTLLAERFDSFQWLPSSGVPRDILMFSGLLGTGLFAYESARNRKLGLRHVQEMREEVELRRDAEQELTALIESSPAAILTLDCTGRILMANRAAHDLLEFEPGTLCGEPISALLPPLARVSYSDEAAPSFRTAMQCYGRRQEGEVFLADVWFSTYKTGSGPRLTAMLVDSSEDLRERQELSLRQLLTGSRLVMGVVSTRSATPAAQSLSFMQIFPGMRHWRKTRTSRRLAIW